MAFQAILPTERFQASYPPLYLLHGLTENSSAWLQNTRIKMWAEEKGPAVVMPSGENSFYLDISVKDGGLGDFGAYIGEELVKVTREMFPLSHKREETYIAGLSMGGYGACRNGLKYCDTFGNAAVLSSAVHFFECPQEWVKTKGNTINALSAADEVLIPMQAHYLSLKGMEQLMRTIARVKRQINPNLTISGILITMADMRTTYSQEIVELLRGTYGDRLRIFDTIIPRSIRVQ